MKKFGKIAGLILLILMIGYGVGIGYYADKFQANTVFGNTDISNLTLDQAQEKITKDIYQQEINIHENGQFLGSLSFEDLAVELNIDEELTNVYKNQNPNQWVGNYFGTDRREFNLTQDIQISDGQLRESLMNLGISNEGREPTVPSQIEYSEHQGYYVVPSQVGNQIDFNHLKEIVTESLVNGAQDIEISNSYVDSADTEHEENIQQMMQLIEETLNTKITLKIAGEDVTIPREEIEKWMYFNENNKIVFDQNEIYEYLGQLNDQYATYNKTREFNSTRDGIVEVQPGTLGWSIDREIETQNIADDLYAGEDVEREPYIVGTGYNNPDENDIGDTYVEISIQHQHMWIYRDGALLVETPIVTGQVGTDTIPGAYAVWDKEENATLKGYNPRTEKEYEVPVSYWLPFDDTGQGIHDANWQPVFGGDTYLHTGSLGCINTPPEIMSAVFESIELGTPVIVY